MISNFSQFLAERETMSNPWYGKAVLQAFWWNCWNTQYASWFDYLAHLAPRLAQMGFDGLWTPQPCKDAGGTNSMGYTPFDYYDLGSKAQNGGQTRFGTQDQFLRMIAVCHANGIEVYPDIVLDHCGGGNNKTYSLPAFAGAGLGRWPRSFYDFHPNPDHQGCFGDWCIDRFDDDICYRGRCSDSGTVNPETYMRPQARAWFTWFVKQTGVDGFRFDDVKDYPPEIVEDLLWNAMGDPISYFCVGEFIPNNVPGCLDQWTDDVKGRSGTFDYPLRYALVNLVYYPESFDMGSLPNSQQQRRLKSVPFVNNHDLWHGEFWDSSGDNQTDRTGYPQNGQEGLGPTLDPDNPRTPLAYAFAVTIDGNPQFFYEDIFQNFAPYRFQTTASAIPTRPWAENLLWCHQKLAFKSGDYFVRYQGSRQFLILERGARAIVAINNSDDWQSQWISTAFFPNSQLHDYSGSMSGDIWTNQDGWALISVPPCSYSVWGPAGITGGFLPTPRRTVQQFEMADDLGDKDPASPQYGGYAISGTYHAAGAVWPANASQVNISVYADSPQTVDLLVHGPAGSPAIAPFLGGAATPGVPFLTSFTAAAEGGHVLTARLSNAGDPPARLYLKVDYMGPALL
jgi:alpha-amylase